MQLGTLLIGSDLLVYLEPIFMKGCKGMLNRKFCFVRCEIPSVYLKPKHLF